MDGIPAVYVEGRDGGGLYLIVYRRVGYRPPALLSPEDVQGDEEWSVEQAARDWINDYLVWPSARSAARTVG